jgi:hypothetical protein
VDRQLIVQHSEFLDDRQHIVESEGHGNRHRPRGEGRRGAAWDDDTTVNDHDDVVAVGGPQTSTM